MKNFSIGEFSKLTGLGIHTLRYYKQEGLVIPERNSANRRCYSEKDVAWVEFIIRLKETGMPIKEIKRYAQLRMAGDKTLYDRLEMLINHRSELNRRIEQLQKHQAKLDDKIEYYKSAISLN